MPPTPEVVADGFVLATDPHYQECATGIGYLDRVIVASPHFLTDRTRSFLLPALYGYWERFVRLVFADYLRAVEMHAIEVHHLLPPVGRELVSRYWDGQLANIRGVGGANHRIKSVSQLQHEVDVPGASQVVTAVGGFMTAPATFPDPIDWVDTSRNIRHEILAENCSRLGVSMAAVESHFNRGAVGGRSLYVCLKDLVDGRNDVAHGLATGLVNARAWTDHREGVLAAMFAVQTALYETLLDPAKLKR